MLVTACAAVVGWFLWRRWQSSKDNDGGGTSGGRSSFKFPTGGKGMPQGRSTNPKKNKAARRAEKAKRKEEREAAK